jgi:hypothetical protein
MALGWEHPALADLIRTNAAFIAQIDLNGRDDYLHSQYLTAKIGIPFNSFLFEAGGVLELAQTGSGSNTGLAGELGILWTLPTAFPSRLSFNGYFSGGSSAAFSPITAQLCGEVLEAMPSGISMLSLDYIARLHKTFSAGLTYSYFIRSDSKTFAGYPIDIIDDDGSLLGNEFFARLIWAPFSDLQINMGGGVFIPAMGNAAPDREPQWRIKLAAVLVF